MIARHLGDLRWIALCWVAGGLISWLGALVYAEVGTRLPETGGELVYLRHGWGRWAEALFGWMSFFLIAPSTRVGLSLVAAQYALGGRGGDAARTLFAAGVIVALCGLNLLGTRPSLRFQRAFVVMKVGGLVLLIGGALVAAAPPAATAAPTAATAAVPGPGAFAAAMLLVFFSYLGWAKVGYVAGEIRDPRSSLPLALLTGSATVIVLYLLTLWSYHRALGLDGVAASAAVAADAASRLYGSGGGALVAAVVVAAALSSMAGSIFTDSRLFLAMARGGHLLRWFDHLHPRFGSPSRVLFGHAAVCLLVLAARQRFELHLSAMVAGRLFFIGLVAASLFRLRRAGRDAQAAARFVVPGGPVLPALFLGAVATLLAGRFVFQGRESLVDLALLAVGLPLLAAERWRRRSRPLPASELKP